jgi:hypothetical protein
MVEEAKRVGLLQYFRKNRPGELVRKGKDYCTRDHDSLCMSENGRWNWISRGCGGKNAIDYLTRMEDYSFQDAVIEVLQMQPTPRKIRENVEKAPDTSEKCKFILPPRDDNNDIVISYLEKRAITRPVLDYFIQNGSLYQERKYHSVCFLACDKDGLPRLANLRGTMSDFKQNTAGSDRRYGFSNLRPGRKSLHLFEAPIDLLSYAVLIQEAGKDFQNYNLMSLSGIYAPRKNLSESKIPACVAQCLLDYPETELIHLHFDNDGPGYYAGEALQEILKPLRVEKEYPPRGYKDVNEYLVKRDRRSVK